MSYPQDDFLTLMSPTPSTYMSQEYAYALSQGSSQDSPASPSSFDYDVDAPSPLQNVAITPTNDDDTTPSNDSSSSSVSSPLSPSISERPLHRVKRSKGAATPSQQISQAITAGVVSTDVVEPKALKRLKHRTLDAERRRRENAAVQQINALVDIAPTDKRDKVAVLDAAVDTIRHLKAQLAAANANKQSGLILREKPNVAARKRKRGDAQSILLEALLKSDFFYKNVFFLSSVVQVVLNADVGTCVMANHAWSRFTGAELDMVNNVACMPPRDRWLTRTPDEVDTASVTPYHYAKLNGVEVALEKPRISKRTKHAIWALLNGKVQSVDVVFKMYNFAGVLYDMSMHVWLTAINAPPGTQSTPNITLMHCAVHSANAALSMDDQSSTVEFNDTQLALFSTPSI